MNNFRTTQAKQLIVVDGQCFQTDSRNRGIGNYSLEILKSLSQLNFEILVVFSQTASPDSVITAKRYLLKKVPSIKTVTFQPFPDYYSRVYRGSSYNDEALFIAFVKSFKPDFFLNLSPLGEPDNKSFVTPKIPGVVNIAIVYDFIPLTDPDTYLANLGTRIVYLRKLEILKTFDQLWCISMTTLNQAQRMLLNREVIFLGGGATLKEKKNQSHSSIAKSLFLVGAGDPRKNADQFIKVFGRVWHKIEHNAVLIGYKEERSYLKHLKLAKSLGIPQSRINFFKHLTDDELASYYTDTNILVMPSKSEGLGIPVLDAMANGVVVLVSDNSSFQEIVPNPNYRFVDDEDFSRKLVDLCLTNQPMSEFKFLCKEITDTYNWDLVRDRIRISFELLDVRSESKETYSLPSNLITKPKIEVEPSWSTEQVSFFISKYLELHMEPLMQQDFQLELGILSNSWRLLNGDNVYVVVTGEINKRQPDGIGRVSSEILKRLEFEFPGRIRKVCQINDNFVEVDWNYFDEYNSESIRIGNRVNFKNGDVILFLGIDWILPVAEQTLSQAVANGARVFSFVHDILPLEQPGWFQPGVNTLFENWLETISSISTSVFVSSNHVNRKLRNHWNSKDLSHKFQDIRTIGLGVNRNLLTLKSRNPNILPEKPFLLMVGTIEPRKGHLEVFEYLKDARESGVDLQLAVIGKMGWVKEREKRKFYRFLKKNSWITYLNQVDDSDLSEAYRRCQGVIAGSHDEGFGLPVIEAQIFDKPVLAREIAIFKEIGWQGIRFTNFKSNAGETLRDFLSFTDYFTYNKKEFSSQNHNIPDWNEVVAQIIVEIDDWGCKSHE